MYIEYRTRKLQTLCETQEAARRQWGTNVAKRLFQRLTEIAGADFLADLFNLPAARCHQLKGNRKGQFAVDLSGGCRLIFEPLGEPEEYMKGAEIDRTKVEAVRILEVTDYHDSKG